MFEQDRVIGRFQRAVDADFSIRSCLLVGSFGQQTADAYADIDLLLVFSTAESRDLAWTRRREFVRQAMPYVSVKSLDGERPFTHTALYGNGSKVELTFTAQDLLEPQPAYAQAKMLKDTLEWGSGYVQRAAAALPAQRPLLTSEQLAGWDDRLWIGVWDTLRWLRRGDSQRPFAPYLTLLADLLPEMLPFLPADSPAASGLRRLVFVPDTHQTLQEVGGLVAAYRTARQQLIALYNLGFTPDERFEREIDSVLQRLLFR